MGYVPNADTTCAELPEASVRSAGLDAMAFRHILSHHVLAERFDIVEVECRELINAIDKRKRMARTAPSIVSLLAAFG